MARSLAIALVLLGAVAASAAATPFSIDSLKSAMGRQAGVASFQYAQYSPRYDARPPYYGHKEERSYGKPEEKHYGKPEERPYGKPEERPYGKPEEKEYGYGPYEGKPEHVKTVWLQEYKQEEINIGTTETSIAYRSSMRCSTEEDDKCIAPQTYEKKPEYGYSEGGFKQYLGSLDVAAATCTWVQLEEPCPADAVKHLGSGSCIPTKATCYFSHLSEQCGEPLCSGLTVTAKGIFFVIEATSCEAEYPPKSGPAPAPASEVKAPAPVPVPVPEEGYEGEYKEHEELPIYKGEAALFVGHIVHISDPHHEWKHTEGKLEFTPAFQGELIAPNTSKTGLKGAVKSDNLPFVKGGALKITFSE